MYLVMAVFTMFLVRGPSEESRPFSAIMGLIWPVVMWLLIAYIILDVVEERRGEEKS